MKFSPHLGYINLFPLIFGLINDPEILKANLDLLENKEEIWSDYGILLNFSLFFIIYIFRSLSK